MRRVLVVGVLALGMMPSRASAIDQREQLRRIEEDIRKVSVTVKTLSDEYNSEKALEITRRPSDRFADAEILFLLGDYPRASLVLFDLVNDRRAKKEKFFAKAVFYLAEAQFQMTNDLAAREYYERVVEYRDENLTDSIRRLIQIADRTERWEGLDARVSVLRKRGRLPPAIAYIHAKSLLRQGKFDAVIEAARDIDRKHKLFPKMRYLVGVATLQKGDVVAARGIFEELVKTPKSADDAKKIRDLAKMNRGRILLEEGNLADSVDAYQDIARNSPLFEEALYEITWTYVRAASLTDDQLVREDEYGKALKALEILLLSEQETTLAPEARLLLGNIYLRLGRFDEATTAFNDVVNRYEPVRDELARLTAEVSDPSEYYDEVSSRSREGGGLLPPLAVKWAAKEKKLSKALEVVTDLDQGEEWLTDIDEMIDKLLTILNSDKRAQFFPALQDAQSQRLELDNTLIALSRRLLAVEREVVQDELDPPRLAELNKVLADRAEIEPDYLKLPQSKEDYEGRLTAMQKQMQGLQKQVYRLGWAVEEQRRSIEGLKSWLVENPGAMSRSEEKDFRDRLSQAETEIDLLEQLKKDLQTEMEKERTLISVTTEAQAREEDVRTRYQATLEREAEILSIGKTAVFGEGKAILAEVDRLRELIGRHHLELENFKMRLAELVGFKAADIKAQLLKERGLANLHRESVDSVRGDAKRVVGEIAYGSLGDVERKFHNIVLRGDVGIVDVAWALKEVQTSKISRWVDQQRRELQVLDNEFREVLEEN